MVQLQYVTGGFTIKINDEVILQIFIKLVFESLAAISSSVNRHKYRLPILGVE